MTTTASRAPGPNDGATPPTERQPQTTERRREQLDRRYGAIGISAVAAAARYIGAAKNPAYAPAAATSRIELRFVEAAA